MGRYTLERWERTFGQDGTGRRYTPARFEAVFGSQLEDITKSSTVSQRTAESTPFSEAGNAVIQVLAEQEKNQHDYRLRERDRMQAYVDRVSDLNMADAFENIGEKAKSLMDPSSSMKEKLGLVSEKEKNLFEYIEQKELEKRYELEKKFGEGAYEELNKIIAHENGRPAKSLGWDFELKYRQYKAERNFLEYGDPSTMSAESGFDYDYEQEKKTLDELLATSALSQKTPYLQEQIDQQMRVVEVLEDLERDALLSALVRRNINNATISTVFPSAMTSADLQADFEERRAVFKELFGDDVDYNRILLRKVKAKERQGVSLSDFYLQEKSRLDGINTQLYQVYDTEAGRQALAEHGYTPEEINRFGGLLTGESKEERQIAKDIREAEFVQKRVKAEKILAEEPEVAEQIRDAYDLLNMFIPNHDGSPERVAELFERVGRDDGWFERARNLRKDILNQLTKQGYDTDTLMEIYTEQRNQQKVQTDRERIAKEANEIGPGILHGLGAVLAGPGKLKGAWYAIGKSAEEIWTGEKQYIDPNSPFFWASQYQSAVRDAQTETAPEWGKFLYRLGMNAADFALTLPLGSTGALVISASSAAGDTAYELAQAGAPNEQIVLATLAAGVLEVLFARVDFGEFTQFASKQPSMLRQQVGKMFRGMVTAGSEGLASTLADDLVDYLISSLTQGQSAHERAVQTYIQQGLTLEEAEWQATLDYIRELSLAFADTAVLEGMQSIGK